MGDKALPHGGHPFTTLFDIKLTNDSEGHIFRPASGVLQAGVLLI